MAQSTEISTTRVVTKDGVVTATVLDKVSPDRLCLMLFRASIAAQYGGVADNTPLLPRSLKNLVVFPFSEGS